MGGIAHICHPYLPKSETFVYERVKRVGNPSIVLTDEPVKNLELFPHRTVLSLFQLSPTKRRINQLWGKFNKPYPAYVKFLKQHGVEVIVAHHGPVAVWAIPLAEKTGLPLVACFYGIDASAFLKEPRWLEHYKVLFQKAALVVVLSKDMASRLIAAGCPESKIFENHLARDVSEFTPLPRETHGGPIRILSVGRLVPKKGFDDVIEVLGLLKAEKIPFLFTLVGEGPEIVRLEKRWFELGIQKEVNWVGALDSQGVKRWMQWSDIFLAPSKKGPDGDEEGTPTVLVEAGLMSCAILSTTHAGIPLMLEDKKEALLVPENNIEEIFNKTKFLIENTGLRKELGGNARLKMETCYSADLEAEKLTQRLLQLKIKH